MKDVAILKPNAVVEFTAEQLELIKSTVAKGATNDELKLFLYRCKNMGLDPLKPGMVHFVKYGSNPGSVVVGIDGIRSRAESTGLRNGIKRGVLRDDKGKCIGAWCEVSRKDWSEPARVEVSLAEYTTGKAMWAKMPESMIQKVAECAALRMAFPDQLSGMYSEEEMQQATPRDNSKAREVEAKISTPAIIEHEEFHTLPEAPSQELAFDYIIKVGKNKGKKIKDLSDKNIDDFISWYDEKVAAGETMHRDVVEYYGQLLSYREQP